MQLQFEFLSKAAVFFLLCQFFLGCSSDHPSYNRASMLTIDSSIPDDTIILKLLHNNCTGNISDASLVDELHRLEVYSDYESPTSVPYENSLFIVAVNGTIFSPIDGTQMIPKGSVVYRGEILCNGFEFDGLIDFDSVEKVN